MQSLIQILLPVSTGTDYEIRELLALNDTLQTSSAALTDLVVVNDFSGEKGKSG